MAMISLENLPSQSLAQKVEIPFRKFSLSSEVSSDSERSQFLLDDNIIYQEENLPPVDRGLGAWKFLLGCWLIEAMLWGFPLAFGIFQSHYTSHPLFTAHSRTIPTIGALAIGISYMGVPLTSPITLRNPKYHRHILCLGWFLCVFSLVLASFATKTWHLLMTQGAMYGVGWVVCYTPFLIMLNDWFDKRRGLAYGILFGASGVSGLILPFGLETLLARWGFRVTLRVIAALMVLISGPGLWFIKPRIPLHLQHQLHSTSVIPQTRNRAFKFLRNPATYIFGASIFLQGLSFPLPPTFLPSYATALSLPASTGDALLAINSLTQVTGQILLGHFSDNVSIHIPHSLQSLIAGISCLLLWGPARDYTSLAAFAGLWGAFAGSYSVSWTKIAAGLADAENEDHEDDLGRRRKVEATMTLYAWFSLERGVADILAGPISEVLLREDVESEAYGLGMWKQIVIFAGVVLLASSLGGLMWFWERLGKRRRF